MYVLSFQQQADSIKSTTPLPISSFSDPFCFSSRLQPNNNMIKTMILSTIQLQNNTKLHRKFMSHRCKYVFISVNTYPLVQRKAVIIQKTLINSGIYRYLLVQVC